MRAITDEAFAVLGSERHMTPFSDRAPGFNLGAAYRIATAAAS